MDYEQCIFANYLRFEIILDSCSYYQENLLPFQIVSVSVPYDLHIRPSLFILIQLCGL
jgi:hypothetical protein